MKENERKQERMANERTKRGRGEMKMRENAAMKEEMIAGD